MKKQLEKICTVLLLSAFVGTKAQIPLVKENRPIARIQ